MRTPFALPLLGVCSLGAAAPALAQLPDIAIVAAATASSTDCRFTDTQSYLLATGFFSSVAIINASSSTPTLQDLQQYDAVLTWSNTTYQDPVTLGNNLADYVDAGGGVVVATFAVSNTGNLRLGGRWVPNYEVILGGSGQTGGQATLGNVLQPMHPLMAGVTSFDGGTSSYRPVATVLNMGAVPIAEWSDGKVLIAAGAMPNRVDVSFYPPPSTCRSDFWDIANTDGDLILGNALAYVATGGGNVGTSYCSPGVPNSTGAAGVIHAMGSATVASNDLTLDVASLPLNAFGFFLTSRTQGMVAQPGGSQGVLCLGGSIGRYVGPGQIKNTGATGTFSLMLNLTAMPTPTGPVAAIAGETWNFQAWHRDSVGGGATSNFTDAVRVVFN